MNLNVSDYFDLIHSIIDNLDTSLTEEEKTLQATKDVQKYLNEHKIVVSIEKTTNGLLDKIFFYATN